MQNAAASLAAPLIGALLGFLLLLCVVSTACVCYSRHRKGAEKDSKAAAAGAEGAASAQDLEKGSIASKVSESPFP